MQNFNRKKMAKENEALINEILNLKKFINEECTARGDVLRMYATMRIAIKETLGDEAVKKVIDAVRDLTRTEETQHSDELHEIFGSDVESPKLK